MRVENKLCVVTGGGSGIGKALCERFAAEGARSIVVVDIDGDDAASVAESVGGRAEVVDVASEDDLTAMLHSIEEDLGPIDLLCNNAGIATGGDPLEVPIDAWQRQWEVNVMSHVYAIRAVLPSMLARGEGHILHTSSMAGILTSHGNVLYATTKHAVVGLAEWMSITYHDEGIRTYLLAPLGVRTPMLGDEDSEWATTAAGPIAEPAEIADQVIEAFEDNRFLILTNPIAQKWMDFKNADSEKWLRGMRRLQQQIQAAQG